MREVRISDATLSEVANESALTLTFKQKLELAKLLDRLGASVIEIEGIKNAKVDSLRIKSCASIVKNSILCVPVELNDASIDLTWKALEDATRARLQVCAAVSPAQMEYIHHKKAPAMREAIIAAITKCAQFTNDVEFVADDATRADREFLVDVINEAINAGATTVTICDAAGTMFPDEFSAFIEALYVDIPSLKDVSLGISCSDALYMADANAIAGIAAGAAEVKATSYPLGGASTDKIAKILSEKSDVVGVSCSIRRIELERIKAQIAWICQSDITSNFIPASVGESDESTALTEHDDEAAVMAVVEKLGYDLSKEDQAEVYEAFRSVVSKKGSVSSRELDAIVASAALQVPATYIIEDYVVNCGNLLTATACVALRKDGEKLETVCLGDGPIAAAYLAIQELTGRTLELDDFQIRAITEGQEAISETVVKIVSDGKMYSGRGIYTDIVGSSIQAFVNALNKIVYEEQK